MVVQGEVDGEGRGSNRTQLASTDATMVPIRPHPLAQRPVDEDQDGRERAPEDPESGVALPDVVKQGRDDRIRAAPVAHHVEPGLVSMSLVGRALREEEPLQFAVVEPSLHSHTLGVVERPCGQNVEEA
jgi:hypothetical protein